MPVQVFPDEGGSIISRHDAVWIDHRNDLENQTVAQMPRVLRDEVVYHAVQDPGAVRLTWVHAPANDHCALLADVDDFVGDGEHWDLQAAEGPCQGGHGLVKPGTSLDCFLEKRVRVGYTRGHVGEFLAVEELVVKGEAVELLLSIIGLSCVIGRPCIIFDRLKLAVVVVVLVAGHRRGHILA